MSLVERQILEVLSGCDEHELHGLELIARTSGKRGTIYIVLNRLEDNGLVSSKVKGRAIPGYPNRRVYSITEEGRKSMEATA